MILSWCERETGVCVFVCVCVCLGERQFAGVPPSDVMMMIAFITVRSSLVPLIEGLCAQIYFRFEISVVCVHIFCFSFSEETIF